MFLTLPRKGGYMDSSTDDSIIFYITNNQETFYRLAYSYVRNKETALDIVQNSIVKALEKQKEIRNPDAIRTWFYRVIVNESLSYIRKNEREFVYEPDILNEMREGAEITREYDLYEQVNELPFELKTVILLRFYEDLSLKEIAEVTNTKLSTVKYRLYTGINKLKIEMEEEAL